jgi:hypothetical protein
MTVEADAVGENAPAEVGAATTVSDRRWLALLILCLGDLMIVLDVTIVGVALPSIRSDLGFSEESLAWVVNAYLITFGGFLLLGAGSATSSGIESCSWRESLSSRPRPPSAASRTRRGCSSPRAPCRALGALSSQQSPSR